MEFTSDKGDLFNTPRKQPKKPTFDEDISWLRNELRRKTGPGISEDDPDDSVTEETAAERHPVEDKGRAGHQGDMASGQETGVPLRRAVKKKNNGEDSGTRKDSSYVEYDYPKPKKGLHPLAVIIPICLFLVIGVGLYFFLRSNGTDLPTVSGTAVNTPVDASTPVPTQKPAYTPAPTQQAPYTPAPMPTDFAAVHPSNAAAVPAASQASDPPAIPSDVITPTAAPLPAMSSDTAVAVPAASEPPADVSTPYFSLWTAERLYSFLADEELRENEDVEESASGVKYSGIVDLVLLEVEAASSEAPVSFVHVQDANTTGRVNMVYKAVNLVFAGAEVGVVRSWVTAHLYRDAEMKFADVNLVIRHLESGHVDFYLCDDAHLSAVPPAPSANDAESVS